MSHFRNNKLIYGDNNESGGMAIFLVAFGIGWMIAHHQAVNKGRYK